MKINEHAADPSNCSLDEVLREQLGIVEGVDAELKNGNETKTIKEWISFGGKSEDFGKKGENDFKSSRAFNHFHDPLENWDNAGFDKWVNFFYYGNYGRSPVSAILWGMNPGQQDFEENKPKTGDWSWGKAREYYYQALTDHTEGERNEDFADCFRALGQVLHLLQDVSVPLHTRNDLHIFPLTKDPFTHEEYDAPVGRWTYETFTKEYLKELLQDGQTFVAHHPNPILLSDPQPESNYSHLAPITGLFDRNQYNEGDPIPLNNNLIGLAEYSNSEFVTQDTMWEYQHPSKNDTSYTQIDWLNPEWVIARDGETEGRIYIRKTVGEFIQHFVRVDYWTRECEGYGEVPHEFSLDDQCWKDYAAKLIPRAVGYSAGLLDYFFRGKMGLNSLPILLDEGTDTSLYFLRLKIKNMTESEETMSDGTYNLIFRYRDGDEEKTVQAVDVSSGELQYGDETEIDFEFPFWP
ncbi:MAG: hypothetical protein JRG69_10275, partial [Deltaproteobacteria bacterium]|nr:hypothetical protein [Deltaproteobacteria bacterium]